MHRTVSLLLALAGTGCAGTAADDTGSGRAPSGDGGSGVHDYDCVEVGRVEVSDTATVPDLFDFAANVVLSTAVGAFLGEAVLLDASGAVLPAVATTWIVGVPTVVWAVTLERRDRVDDTGLLPEGEFDPEACPPFYEGEVSLRLITDDWALSESLVGSLVIRDASGATAGGTIEVSSLVGTYRPGFDPADYDTATLSVAAATSADGWHGDLEWTAANDAGDGAGEGVVGPAGSFDVSATKD